MDGAESVAAVAEAPDPAPDGLIAPAAEIFDHAAVLADLEAIALDAPDIGAARERITGRLRDALAIGRARIETAFETERRSGQMAARSVSWLTDQVLNAIFLIVSERLFPRQTVTTAEQIAVIATGGYGRGEMAPYSDVDLLFLTPYKQTAWGESVIEATLFTLWDLKFKVGHASRSLDECLRMARADITIRTALLEQRCICGERALFESLEERLWTELFERSGPEFIEAKLAERDKRHERTGGSRYLLEPNIKESKGGLRDIQTLAWIAKYLYRAKDLGELVEMQVLTSEEATRCRNALAHLWTVRFGLHYLARRAQEKLTFDYQVELAERFGYRAGGGQRPVERFMKRYFLAAKDVGDLTRIFCAQLEQQHKKAPPLLGGLRRLFAASPRTADGEQWLENRDGRLMVRDPQIFGDDPIKILQIFDEAIRADVLIHPTALRLLDRSRRLIDDDFRALPEARALFVSLLTESKDPTRALRRMSETGVLPRFIPEFGRVTGLMQFNMYHHYTVDEHTIMAIDALEKMRSGALRREHPIATEIAQSLTDRRVIAIALFLHDIGKGLPEDHSVAGEAIARRVCLELDLSEAETEQVAWLVRWHLLMSDTAQKRDVGDPATVRAFVDVVQSPSRLKLLYLLTSCDIRAVGPGVWNGWKGQLLEQLYHEARVALTGDQPSLTRSDRIDAAQSALREALPEWIAERWDAHRERFFPTYWISVNNATHRMHATLMSEVDDADARDRINLRWTPSETRQALKLAFYLPDHFGLFARLAGAFALAGETVLDARVFTTKDGMAINTFWIADEVDESLTETERRDDTARRIERIEREVGRTLKGDVVARDALRKRRKLRQRERSFEVQPRVVIDNDASDSFTVVEVNGRDRVGLLYDLARALANENVNIISAIIATYGEHAVDVFYVRDLFGMKITRKNKQQRIEAELLAALARSGDST